MRREETEAAESRRRAGEAAPVGRREAIWSVVFLLIVAASVWAITSQVRGFSFEGFVDSVREASVPWLPCVPCTKGIYLLPFAYGM